MIENPGGYGVAFTERSDGNQRSSEERTSVAERLGISSQWATATQVHGSFVHRVDAAGDIGEGDGLWTTQRGLPLAVLTADCFGVAMGSDNAVGVAHAGWRGTEASVVTTLRDEMTQSGYPPTWAAIGPGIQACCFEVGHEVASLFPGSGSRTTWGTVSVNLENELRSQLDGLELWASGACTMSDPGWFSHRATGTGDRLATVAWLP